MKCQISTMWMKWMFGKKRIAREKSNNFFPISILFKCSFQVSKKTVYKIEGVLFATRTIDQPSDFINKIAWEHEILKEKRQQKKHQQNCVRMIGEYFKITIELFICIRNWLGRQKVNFVWSTTDIKPVSNMHNYFGQTDQITIFPSSSTSSRFHDMKIKVLASLHKK